MVTHASCVKINKTFKVLQARKVQQSRKSPGSRDHHKNRQEVEGRGGSESYQAVTHVPSMGKQPVAGIRAATT